jgi:cyclic pyranopterin phosphate synthase
MVDVGHKPITRRTAVARGAVWMNAKTLAAIVSGNVPKGEVLAVARVAGIMAAKRCGELIPLCHGLSVDSVRVELDLPAAKANRAKLGITATATISAKTGVEMEALTAVAVAALTIYDMCKAIDKTMVIDGIELIEKTGGQSDLKWPVRKLPGIRARR